MIVVLIPHYQPARVAMMTEEDVIALVNDADRTGRYIATIPPGELVDGFAGAWMRLRLKMKFAARFETAAEAIHHFENAQLPLQLIERARVLKALKDLRSHPDTVMGAGDSP